MISDEQARALFYDWHSGQTSAFYAAASSGLVKCFEAIHLEMQELTPEDQNDLREWLNRRFPTVYVGEVFYALPWYK